MTRQITIWGQPAGTAYQSRVVQRVVGRPFATVYKSKSATRWMKEAKRQIEAGDRWEGGPWSGPVSLNVKVFMKRPDRLQTKRARDLRAVWHVAKPDSTNVLKLVEDAFKGVWWVDDSQVVHTSIQKFYADTGTEARVEVWAGSLES